MTLAERIRWPIILLLVYAGIWTALAISPVYREAWFLENILIFIAIPFLIFTYQYFRLSNLSYNLIFVFLVLHAFGSHYTYAEVPFGFWLKELFGFTRNNYDRITHFAFGLLLAYPVRELFMRVAQTKGIWSYWFPVELTIALSALFEIGEWITVILSNPQAGSAFLGEQGDTWEAVKDMACASVGAILAMAAVMITRAKLDPEFRSELVESIRIKRATPLGEIEFARLENKSKPKRRKT